MVTFDINTVRVPETRRVWRFFPGEKYRFLDHFVAYNTVFLNLPGFEVSESGVADDETLLPRILLSLKTAEILRKEGTSKNINLRISEFQHERLTPNRSRLRNTTLAFFNEVQSGDLIVMPDQYKNRRIYVGEIGTPAREHISTLYESDYGLIDIPGKAVTTFKSFDENKISTNLSKILRHEHSLSDAGAENYVEVFSLFYGDFVFGDVFSSTVDVTSDLFLDIDSALLSYLTTLAAQACRANDSGTEIEYDRLMLPALGDTVLYNCRQVTDVHSPGFFRYFAEKATPNVATVLLSVFALLGSCESIETLELVRRDIVFMNSAADRDDPCNAAVSEASSRLIRTMPIQTLWHACQAAKAAKDRAGLRSRVHEDTSHEARGPNGVAQ